MRLRTRFAVALVAGLAYLTVPSLGHADDRAEARRHFLAGIEFARTQQYPEAIAEFEAAYAIIPKPNALYNIARAYNVMGNTDKAIEYLRRYAETDPPDRADIDPVIARLEERRRQTNATAAVVPTTVPTVATPVVSEEMSATARMFREQARSLEVLAQGTTQPSQAQSLRSLAQDLQRRADAIDGHAGTSQATHTGPDTNGNTDSNGNTDGQNPTTGNGTTAPPEAVSIASAQGDEEAYDERLVTASRQAQSPLDSPNASGVITAQDIRLSGLTSIPALMRRLVGMDIMELDSGDTQVSVRGFNQRMSNKVLVLIDGRSVYLDSLGQTTWPLLFPAVEEIERIEVIRGPGSALYGADAFTGVINIITRVPGEGRSSLSFGAGNGQFRGALVATGRQGRFSYRASVQYEQRDLYNRQVGAGDTTWINNPPTGDVGTRAPRFNIDMQARLGRNIILRGGVGASVQSSFDFLATGLLRRFFSSGFNYIQPWVQLEAGPIQVRAFFNHIDALAGPEIAQVGTPYLLSPFSQNVLDIDAQGTWKAKLGIVQNTFQVGLGARMKQFSWNFANNDQTLGFFSAFLQDTFRVGEKFVAVASARMDYHPILNAPVFSPRAALIFKPTLKQAIRISGGTAFRTPTLLELYFNLTFPTPIPGVAVQGQGGEVYRNATGADHLDAESAISFDLGYKNQELERFQFEVNGFLTRGSKVISLTTTDIAPLAGTVNMGSLGTGTLPTREIIVGSRHYQNDPGATWLGGIEAVAKVSPVDGLDINANYTFAYTVNDPNSLLAASGGRPADQRTPQHKFNIGLQYRAKFGLDLEAYFHYVGSQVWIEEVFDARQGSRLAAFSLPDYGIVNARVGWRLFNDKLSLGVVGTNIIDPNPTVGHQEHPFGSRLGVRVMGTASYSF